MESYVRSKVESIVARFGEKTNAQNTTQSDEDESERAESDDESEDESEDESIEVDRESLFEEVDEAKIPIREHSEAYGCLFDEDSEGEKENSEWNSSKVAVNHSAPPMDITKSDFSPRPRLSNSDFNDENDNSLTNREKPKESNRNKKGKSVGGYGELFDDINDDAPSMVIKEMKKSIGNAYGELFDDSGEDEEEAPKTSRRYDNLYLFRFQFEFGELHL
jgi:hypothetical protein